MKRYLVHATITCELEVDVDVDSQDTAVQKHVAGQLAQVAIRSRLDRTGLNVTGVSTGAIWPTEPHQLADHFFEGAGMPPERAAEGGTPARQIVEAEVVGEDDAR